MILPVEAWMDIRRFAPLRAAGATWKEIAAEAGCDWRTARKYLSPDAPVGPPQAPSRAGTQPRLVDPYTPVIDGWLVSEPRLRASVIHERLVADYGFTGHYQRIKTYVREARVRLELEADPSERPPALHRRFEVTPGAQAQVDWGDEGMIETAQGRRKVYSFHMTLSHSRDPFVCFTHRQDLATFFDCHSSSSTCRCRRSSPAEDSDRATLITAPGLVPAGARIVTDTSQRVGTACRLGSPPSLSASGRPVGAGRVATTPRTSPSVRSADLSVGRRRSQWFAPTRSALRADVARRVQLTWAAREWSAIADTARGSINPFPRSLSLTFDGGRRGAFLS